MEEPEFKTKAAKYRHHILKAQDFSGTIKEYCQKFDLDPIYFYHCRGQMGFSKKINKKPTAFAEVIEPPAVQKVGNYKEESQSDAKWLAEFVNHYLNLQ